MIGLNLLPDVKKEFIKAQQTRNTVISISIIAMVIAAGITVLLALFVYAGQSAMIQLAKNDVTTKQNTFSQKPEVSKYLTIQNQLDALKTLQDSQHKILYSRLLDFLPQLNPAAPNNVKLGIVDVKQTDTAIDIQGTAADFHAVDTFKNTLENAKITYKLSGESKEVNLFSDVSLKAESLTRNNGVSSATFEFMLTYSTEAFSPDATEIQLNVPKLTISDSQTNAPSELFTDGGKN